MPIRLFGLCLLWVGTVSWQTTKWLIINLRLEIFLVYKLLKYHILNFLSINLNVSLKLHFIDNKSSNCGRCTNITQHFKFMKKRFPEKFENCTFCKATENEGKNDKIKYTVNKYHMMAQELFSSYLVLFGIDDFNEVIEASSVSWTSETKQLKILREESLRLLRRCLSLKLFRRFVFFVKEEPAALLRETEIVSSTLSLPIK